MSKSFAPYLVEDTRFWVVAPRIAGGQVTGIGTLLSGSYIGLDVGKSMKPQREFDGLETPPVVTGDIAGRQYIIHAPDQGSLDVGASIFFRRVPVGRVLSSDLDKDGAGVTMRIFVEAPHDHYVTTNTRFWNASGVDLTFDSKGLRVQTQSLVSVLLGGIAFETPGDAPATAEAGENTIFRLFEDRDQAIKSPDKQAYRFMANFSQSLRGLTVGSPVEFHGLPLGEVTSIGAEYDLETRTYRFPVEITLHPDRLTRHFKTDMMREGGTGLITQGEIDTLIGHGLRAQLNTGNLLTGQLFVALDFFPDAENAGADWTKTPPELPTTPGALSGLEQHLSSLATKLDKVPFDAIAGDLRNALRSMHTMLRSTESLVQRLDKEVAPAATHTLGESRQALRAVERLLSVDAPFQQDARETLRQIGQASQSLQRLADFLERHPETLIRGRESEEEP